MGCDGGSIPKRAEMVKTKKKLVREASDSQVKFWTCFLSQTELKAPIVSDGLGRLFNREAVLEWLVGDREIELENVKSIKDFTTLTLKVNPLFNSKESSVLLSSSSAKDSKKSCPFMCPITQKEMNGTFKFIYPPCGCVVAELAIQNVKETSCLVCGKEYAKDDIITIYPTDQEEINRLTDKIITRQQKSRKRKGNLQETGRKKENSVKKVNIPLPNLSNVQDLPFGMGPNSKTKVLESIFLKKDEKGRVIDDGNSQNFLVKGTFNRSAASF